LLMNAMLASNGYPWTVIRVEDRAAYLKALKHRRRRPLLCFVHRRARAQVDRASRDGWVTNV
jgi:hypothetical protein